MWRCHLRVLDSNVADERGAWMSKVFLIPIAIGIAVALVGFLLMAWSVRYGVPEFARILRQKWAFRPESIKHKYRIVRVDSVGLPDR